MDDVCRVLTVVILRFFRTTGRISGLLLNVRAALGACAVCIVVATMVFTIGLHDDNRLNVRQ